MRRAFKTRPAYASNSQVGYARVRAARATLMRANRMAAVPGAFRRNRAVKGAIKARKELKYVDTNTNCSFDTTGTVACLNLLAVGDDNTNRDGRQVTIKSVALRGTASPYDASVAGSMIRYMLVWDNAANGALATVAQILATSTAIAFPLVDNANRFTILKDVRVPGFPYQTTATQALVGGDGIQMVDCYLKMDNVTQYVNTTAVIGSIQNGALLLVTLGSNVQADSYFGAVNARVRFTDD